MFQNLRYAEFEAESNVFDYGDEGELFYIIMEGEVKIKIPAPDILEDDQCSPEGFLIFLIEYWSDIYWSKLRLGLEIREMLIKLLNDSGIPADVDGNFDKKKALQKLDRAIYNNKTTIHDKIFNIANPESKKTITVSRFKEVARLSDGCSFGELALLKNEGRAATI